MIEGRKKTRVAKPRCPIYFLVILVIKKVPPPQPHKLCLRLACIVSEAHMVLPFSLMLCSQDVNDDWEYIIIIQIILKNYDGMFMRA